MTGTLVPIQAPSSRPPDAPTAPGRRRPRRRTVVIALATLAVVATGVGLDVSARADHAAARRLLRTRRAELAATTTRLHEARAALGDAQDGVASTQRDTDLRARERRDAQRSLTSTRSDLAGARTRLDGLHGILGLQGGQIAALDTCLNGVSGALGAVRSGGSNTVVWRLRAVDGSCRQVLAPGGEGAVFPFDFADPFVLRVGSTFYAYSTNAGGGTIQIIRSQDLRTWEWLGNALAALPAWAAPDTTWAPSVVARPGGYVAYYTTRDAASGRQCISRAIASRPDGPFVDTSTGPLVCQLDLGGSIDPSPFVDVDGTLWLVWKSDGVDRIWSMPMRADGLAPAWWPTALLAPDQAWEHGVIEGPSMTFAAGRYWLFYSGGSWNGAGYAQSYATCAGPAGPCTKPQAGPLLASHGTIAGPGGGEVFTDTMGGAWLAYHAYTVPAVGYPNSRTLHLLRLSFAYGRPVLTPPM
jgi:hypothetical protein